MLEYLAQVAKGPMQKLEVCASGTPHLPSFKQSPIALESSNLPHVIARRCFPIKGTSMLLRH